jgi:hypothetical protein
MILSSKTQFLILTLITSSGTIFGMENYLCFYLNGNREIEASSAQGNMRFYIEPKDFEGKDIVEVLPLADITRMLILKKFNQATKEKKSVDVDYELENNNFTAEITPLSSQKGNSYFVKVWQKIMNSGATISNDPLSLYVNGKKKSEFCLDELDTLK